MTINKKGLLFRYAYSFHILNIGSDGTYSDQSNLCRFFWRVFFTTLGWVGIIVGLTLATLLLVKGWYSVLQFLLVFGVGVICVGMVGGLVWLIIQGIESEPAQLVGEFLHAKKNKYCPTIFFKE